MATLKLLSCFLMLAVLSLCAMEEKVGDDQKFIALWHLVGSRRARLLSSCSTRNFGELDRQNLVITIKSYDASGKLLEKTIQKFDTNGRLEECCLVFDACSLYDDQASSDEQGDSEEMVAMIGKVFESVSSGDYEGTKDLLSQYPVPINYQTSEGKTLLMEAVEHIESDHWSDLVALILRHGARSDLMDGAGSTVFDAKSLQPDTIMQRFADDFTRRSRKFTAAEVILQMLIVQANFGRFGS